MTVLTTSKTWLDVAATTIENYRPNFYDQITDAIPLLKIAKKNMSVTLDGGDGIVVELMYQHNNTVGSYAGYDLLDLTPQTPFTAAKFDWKDVAGSLSISQDEIDRNAGKSQMMNLLQGKIKNLRLSFQNQLNTMLYLDGSGNNNKDITGLASVIADAGTNTFGGINRNNETWWRNVAYSYATATQGAGYLGVNSAGVRNVKNLVELAGGNATHNYDTTFLYAVDYVYDEVCFGDTGPQLILTSQPICQRLKHSLINNKRYDMSDTLRADPGFRYVNFNGIPVAFDRAMLNCANPGNLTNTHKMYFLNFDFMNFWIHSKKNFMSTDFFPLRPRQDAWAMNMFLKAQLGCSKSNAQAVIHSMSPTANAAI